MIRIEDLKNIGLTDNYIAFLISKKHIDDSDEGIKVLDASFYDVIFFKLYDKEYEFRNFLEKIEDEAIKEFYYFIYSINFLSLNEILKSMEKVDEKKFDISVFKTMIERRKLKGSSYNKYPDYLGEYIKGVDNYINRGSSVLAACLIKKLFDYDDNLFLRSFYQLCLKLEDDITYIVDPYLYRNPLVLEHYRAYERELLFYLDTGDLERAGYMNDIMLDLYQEQKPLALILIAAFLKKIQSAKLNKNEIGSRSEMTLMGDVDSVLIGLLVNKDYYRLKEIIDNKYEQEKTDIKYYIYKRLIDILIKIIDKNNELFMHRVDICAFGENELSDFIGEFDVSRIPLEIFQNFEDKEENPFIDDTNYYRKYEFFLSQGDLKNALLAIKKFQYLLNKMKIHVCFDYIEKDLTDRIKMEEDSENDIKQFYKYCDLGDNLFMNWKYREALDCYLRASKFIKSGYSSFYSKIAECYYNLGNIEAAINFYTKAKKHLLYPKDILIFIECLFIQKKYKMVLELVELYENYYFFEKPKIHYMASICEACLGNFKGAISELEIAEMIIKDVHKVDYYFGYEREVIEEMKRDRKTPCFTMDTYIEFELTEYERRKKEQFDEYFEYLSDPVDRILFGSEEDTKSFEDQMEYLFCLLKVLIIYNRKQEAKNVYDFIAEALARKKEVTSSSKYFTLILKNYKNI